MSYEVYATRFDNPHIVEELIPAKGLEFSMPLSDHGEASFTATVEPGKSFWRPSVALPISGILIARDGVPVWSGWVTDESPAGPRSFQFTCKEWGYFFEQKVPAVARIWNSANNLQILRDLISDAQAIGGQNLQIQLGSALGTGTSDHAVYAYDDTTVGREMRSVSDLADGGEWYFGTAGTLANPVRQLVQGDPLGHTTPQTVLEFVEATEDYQRPDPPPTVILLGGLYPGAAPSVPTRRAGGNLIAQGRTRSVANAATVAIGIGSGDGLAQLRRTATAPSLLAAGWPRMSMSASYPEVGDAAALQARAAADLAKNAGITTGYSLISLDGDPDWTQTPRGSVVRTILDTDIYGADQPVGGPDGFDARLQNTIVRVPDAGNAQVEWRIADALEVS